MTIVSSLGFSRIHYEKIREIGQNGRNSRVFLVRDEQLDTEIVVKEIDRASCDPGEYFREARILYSSSHEGIVPIHYCGQTDDTIQIGMPFYKKGCLKDLISNGNHLTLIETIRYSLQVITALHNIHSKGLVHLDVKPDNVLISDSNSALISDFGVARFLDDDGSVETPKMYSLALPPEAFKRAKLDAQSDIYQLGLMLHRMIVGNDVFYDNVNRIASRSGMDSVLASILDGSIARAGAMPFHVPRKLSQIVAKCMNVDPRQRYMSVLHVANDLADLKANGLEWRYRDEGGIRSWERDRKGMVDRLELHVDGSSDCTLKGRNGKIQKQSKLTRSAGNPLKENEILNFLGAK